MSGTPVLAARDLEVRYRSVEAVRGIAVEVGAGEVLGLIGPDGAGKTSTVRVLAGLRRPDGGSAEAFGLPIWEQRRALHQRIGYLAQGFALYGDLTVDENVQFFGMLYGVRDWRARRDRLLELVALDRFRDRLADQLSGGMKQKLALACTLIHSPEVLLLDEPTAGVDPVTRRELWRLLGELVAEGLTLVVTTPYLDEAERCSRVLLMHHGRVLAEGEPSEIPKVVSGTLVEVTAEPRAAAENALRELPEVAAIAVFGNALHARLELSGDRAVQAVRHALDGAALEALEVRVIAPSLEDAFLYLTARAARTTEVA